MDKILLTTSLTECSPLEILTYAIIDAYRTIKPFGKQANEYESYIAVDTVYKKYKLAQRDFLNSVNSLVEKNIINKTLITKNRPYDSEYTKYTFSKFIKNYTVKKRFINGQVVNLKSYQFKCSESFKLISKDVLTCDLTNKQKGVLLKLILLSDENLNLVCKEDEAYSILGITKKYAKKYFELFLEKGFLNKKAYFTFQGTVFYKEDEEKEKEELIDVVID